MEARASQSKEAPISPRAATTNLTLIAPKVSLHTLVLANGKVAAARVEAEAVGLTAAGVVGVIMVVVVEAVVVIVTAAAGVAAAGTRPATH
jgi:hypothetical protein